MCVKPVLRICFNQKRKDDSEIGSLVPSSLPLENSGACMLTWQPGTWEAGAKRSHKYRPTSKALPQKHRPNKSNGVSLFICSHQFAPRKNKVRVGIVYHKRSWKTKLQIPQWTLRGTWPFISSTSHFQHKLQNLLSRPTPRLSLGPFALECLPFLWKTGAGKGMPASWQGSHVAGLLSASWHSADLHSPGLYFYTWKQWRKCL